MKNIRNIVIIFTVLMLLALAVFCGLYFNVSFKGTEQGSFTDAELEMYKNVWNNAKSAFDTSKNDLFKFVFAFWGIVLVAGYGLIAVVWFTLIKPVREMQRYASDISKGNLDVRLPIHKNNLFGNFTESFDQMRGALKDAKRREMEADKAKRDMVAELSHDLKTPVATISATCEVLDVKYRMKKTSEDDADIDDTLEKIGYISKKTEMINSLVENLFRATCDDMEEIHVIPVETESVIVQSFFRNYDDYAHIIFENNIPECLVNIDRLRMEQVIDNIIGNSAKYAGTDIKVSFSETVDSASDNKFIKITIRDFGPGVDEEELPLIVEKFARGKISADKPGYGLGLYLANLYMEKMGGGMNYYNDNGFVVELLLRKI
ncbi:MAG: HAMP domain-containing histidine kinase [Clostridiales bacterium]|nr:HAMP domain-containing histidine kinase [Clostridiales bacterium]